MAQLVTYEEPEGAVPALARLVGAGLGAGDGVLAIASASDIAALDEVLRGRGFDVARARAEGRYASLAAAQAISKIFRTSKPDAKQFQAVFAGAIRGLTVRAETVRVVAHLLPRSSERSRGKLLSALAELWSELREKQDFSLVCLYPSGWRSPDGPAIRSTGREPAAAAEAGMHPAANETARLAAIVDCSDDAIIGKTLDGVITSWNRGAERIFGFSASEMIGESISRIIPPDLPHDFARILDSIRRGERVDHYETQRVRKDGQRIFVSLTVSPILDGDGHVVGASKIARDITERRRLDAQRELLSAMAQRAYAESVAASRAKDEFLATLGHELRNPLTAVRNALDTVERDPEAGPRALRIAHRQVRQLARLVDDLLDLERVTQGVVRLNREVISLNELVGNSLDAARFGIEERGHRLVFSPAAESIRLECDLLRMEQVLANLLTNAAKFTPAGGQIEVRCESGNGTAVIRIRDDGIGIEAPLLARIFDPMVQAPRAESMPEGLGIGLAIARTLVTLHGGTIEAHSEGPGKGAEFVVRLPAVAAAPERPVVPAPRVRPAPTAALKIVVVDDNADVAESMAMLLETLGHQVRTASNGAEALDAVQVEVPALVLVDIGLPGMDGYEVARRIRQSPALRDAFLVALTGYGLPDDRKRALQSGFDQHLTKPADPRVLRELLARVQAVRAAS